MNESKEKQMQEMAVSILLDEYTHLDVEQLVHAYDEEEESGEVPNIPDALDEACARRIRREVVREKRKKHYARIPKVLSRAAVVTLVLIGLCSTMVLSVEAWRAPALRFVVENFDRRSSVSIEGEVSQEGKTPEEMIESLKDRVPQDYKMLHFDVQDGYYQIKYAGDAGKIINLSVRTYQYETYIDTEATDGNRISINGNEVLFLNKNGYKVIWVDERSELLIEIRVLNISEQEFWRIVHKIIK